MPLRNCRLILAYDGTDYSGFQIQANAPSVQGDLEAGLSRMHKHPVRVVAAGRTDAGVHARGQVVSFQSDISGLSEADYPRAVNSFLPRAVRVRAAAFVDSDFHARYSARARQYTYYFSTAGVLDPGAERYRLRLRRVPDLRLLNAYAREILGDHDFTTFAGAKDLSRSFRREVLHACFYPEGTDLVFRIAANAFLWKMVRSLGGTMLDLVARAAPPEEMRRILESRDRSEAGATLPPQGLFLDRVFYPGDEI